MSYMYAIVFFYYLFKVMSFANGLHCYAYFVNGCVFILERNEDMICIAEGFVAGFSPKDVLIVISFLSKCVIIITSVY